MCKTWLTWIEVNIFSEQLVLLDMFIIVSMVEGVGDAYASRREKLECFLNGHLEANAPVTGEGSGVALAIVIFKTPIPICK